VLIVYDPVTGQPMNIASAQTIKMFFRFADEAVIEKVATLHTGGTDGKIAYQVNGTEFKEGRWKVEGFVTLGVAPNDQDLYSTSASFEVEPRI